MGEQNDLYWEPDFCLVEKKTHGNLEQADLRRSIDNRWEMKNDREYRNKHLGPCYYETGYLQKSQASSSQTHQIY